MVHKGGEWDYKRLDPVGLATTGKSKYEDAGNFNYGAVATAAGFDRGNTILRMAGYIQVQDADQPGDGGKSGSLDEIVSDFVLGINGGESPYGDQSTDQRMIMRGRAYYKARCHKR